MSVYASDDRPTRVVHWASLAAAGSITVVVVAASFATALLFASGILTW